MPGIVRVHCQGALPMLWEFGSIAAVRLVLLMQCLQQHAQPLACGRVTASIWSEVLFRWDTALSDFAYLCACFASILVESCCLVLWSANRPHGVKVLFAATSRVQGTLALFLP